MTDLDWRIGINSVTLKQATLEDRIMAAGECGYDGFGFWVRDLQQQGEGGRTAAEIAELLRSWKLEACELLAVRKWQETPIESFEEAENEARAVFKLASQLGTCLVTSPAGPTLHTPEDWRLRVERICDIAAEYGITIALEFIRGRSISDFSSTVEIVRSADRENVGVLLDIFHFHRSGCTPDDLGSVEPQEVALVHIDDVAAKPLDALRDQDRVFPGDGVAPTSKIVSALADIGYNGYFSVEIFNEEYWRMDPKEAARIALQKTRSVLGL